MCGNFFTFFQYTRAVKASLFVGLLACWPVRSINQYNIIRPVGVLARQGTSVCADLSIAHVL